MGSPHTPTVRGYNLVRNGGQINDKAHRRFETERVGVLMALPLPFSSFESVVTGLLGRTFFASQSLPFLGHARGLGHP